MSPAKSRSQRNLMAAAAHGATFPKAKHVRASMSASSLHDFAKTPTKKLPVHVKRSR